MIKKAVKAILKFLFKPVLNRYHLILDKLNNLDLRINEKLSNQQNSLDLVLQKAKRMELWNQFILSQLVNIKCDEEIVPFKNFMMILKIKDKKPVAEQIRQTADYGENFELIFNKPGVFLDLGANIGAISLKLASFGWKGYAFEAGAINADLLERSIKINKLDVKVIKKQFMRKAGKYISWRMDHGGILKLISMRGVMAKSSAGMKKLNVSVWMIGLKLKIFKKLIL